ncbi:all-trans-retinol 13,14-reductase-like [Bolinopsis microptera]|uniref:all-trans-retinol 13,14-reductase-like n=1 Tax=Bolinopsis microptera TaxID=2820187 RepID=UPI00307A80BC
MEVAIFSLTFLVLAYYVMFSNIPHLYKIFLGMAAFLIVGLRYLHKTVFWLFYPDFGSKNPFSADSRVPRKPYEMDHRKRDAIIKQSFTVGKVQEQVYDAVVVGSGIGGMTVAAILSKIGKKVLVLEQHDQAGGCCHSFVDKNYEFDVGIHYIGEMDDGRYNRVLVDQLTDGQLEWAPLMNPFDKVAIGVGDDKREYPIFYDLQRFAKELKPLFPVEEHDAIDEYVRLVKEFSQLPKAITGVLKLMPLSLTKFLLKMGVFKDELMKCQETTASLVKRLTANKDLQTVFTYCWGDYGTEPEESSFRTQAGLVSHFAGTGGFYPVGGASEIALNIIPVIEKSGGQVLVNARVEKIVVENGAVRGVQVARKNESCFLESPIVVSAAGLMNTCNSLLDESVVKSSAYFSRLLKQDRVKAGVGTMSVFLGLNRSGKELNLVRQNTWAFTDEHAAMAGTQCDYFTQENAHNASDKNIPLLFISFPSTKDPNWDNHPERREKSTVAIVTFAQWEWFESWDDQPLKRRGDDYDRAKKLIGQKMIDQTCQLFPQIEEYIDYVDIGTPVTNNHYISSTKGEIYGLDHNVDRFAPEANAALRPETDISGLIMTGQDVLMCGFTGALMGGALTSCAMLKRDIFTDIWNLRKKSYPYTKKVN